MKQNEIPTQGLIHNISDKKEECITLDTNIKEDTKITQTIKSLSEKTIIPAVNQPKFDTEQTQHTDPHLKVESELNLISTQLNKNEGNINKENEVANGSKDSELDVNIIGNNMNDPNAIKIDTNIITYYIYI